MTWRVNTLSSVDLANMVLIVCSLLQVIENIGYGVIRKLYSLLQVIENTGYAWCY